MNQESELKRREVLRMSNEESHKLTLECIRSALIYLMGSKPYEKITITEIIERSGVSRAAFYRNYSSKDEVLQDEMEELRNLLQEVFSNSLIDSNPKQWLIQFFEEIRKNRKEVEMLLKANLDYDKIFTKLDLDTDHSTSMNQYKTAMYISSLWVVVKLWLKNDFRETPEALAMFIMDIFVIPNQSN